MIEILIAMVILVTAFVIILSTFNATINAWNRGEKMLDELHHGDFVMDQMVAALRSAAFFPNNPDKFGFWLKDSGGSYPNDEISWVKSGTAFMVPDSPLTKGLHRIHVSIEDNDAGDPAVAIKAYPYLADEEELDVDPWFVSSRVKGINCRVYNEEDEDWDDTWEDTNAIPSVVEITLYMDPIKEYGEPVIVQRLIEIPIAPAVTGAVTVAEGGAGGEGGGEGQEGGTSTTNAQTRAEDEGAE